MFTRRIFSINPFLFLIILLILTGCSNLHQGLVPSIDNDVITDTLSFKSIKSISDGITQVALQTSSVEDLKGYSVILSYDTALLTVEEVTEGDFLASEGETFFYKKINREEGTVQIDCVLLGKDLSVSGTGNLAIISITGQKSSSANLIFSQVRVSDSTARTMVLVRGDVQSKGDFNDDGQVDFEDLMLLSLLYGMTLADPNWDGKYDLNADNQIDFDDLMVFSILYEGQQYPNAILPQTWATGSGTASDPWANDCIDKAIAAAGSGDTIYLKAGYYQLSGESVINKDNITIMGAGIGKTIVLTDNAHGFSINGYDNITIQDMTIDGSAQTNGWSPRMHGIYPANCDYFVVKNVEVKNCGTSGINPYQVNNSTYENLLLHDNYEHGIHPGAEATGRNHYNTYRNIDTWNNNYMGFSDRGNGQASPLLPLESSYNVYDNITAYDNGSNGIQVSYQKDVSIYNCTTYDNDAGGFRFSSLANSTIENSTVTGNCLDSEVGGISIYASKAHPTYVIDGLEFTNVIVKNTYQRSGIRLSGYVKGVDFTDCISNDEQATMTQTYGLRLGGTAIDDYAVTLNNCTLSPNKDGEIKNLDNYAINTDTETMLAKLY